MGCRLGFLGSVSRRLVLVLALPLSLDVPFFIPLLTSCLYLYPIQYPRRRIIHMDSEANNHRTRSQLDI